jgi:hypothetical protein
MRNLLSLIGVVVVLAGGGTPPHSNLRPVKACPEDETLIGRGNFLPTPGPATGGRWAFYVCGPARDDFAP